MKSNTFPALLLPVYPQLGSFRYFFSDSRPINSISSRTARKKRLVRSANFNTYVNSKTSYSAGYISRTPAETRITCIVVRVSVCLQ
jgi:hypothetical protein